MSLDALESGEYVRVKERERGSQLIPGRVAGVGADGGDAGCRHCQRCGSSAGKSRPLGDAQESRDHARVNKEARGDGGWPESSPKCVGDHSGVWTNSSSLGAVGRRCLGEMKEQEQAFNMAWARRGFKQIN